MNNNEELRRRMARVIYCMLLLRLGVKVKA